MDFSPQRRRDAEKILRIERIFERELRRSVHPYERFFNAETRRRGGSEKEREREGDQAVGM
jgi:hypothetical protein